MRASEMLHKQKIIAGIRNDNSGQNRTFWAAWNKRNWANLDRCVGSRKRSKADSNPRQVL